MSANYPHSEPGSWIPDDAASIMRQVVHTQVEYQPQPQPVYTPSDRDPMTRAARTLTQDASHRTRVAVANLILTLAGITASVFLIALVILGVRIWTWLI